MADIMNFYDGYNDDGHECLSFDAAQDYTQAVATEAIQEYIRQTGEPKQGYHTIKGDSIMSKTDGIQETAQAVLTESITNAGLISGEILLDNIETLAERLVLSRLSWWKRWSFSKSNKEIAVTLAAYAIVHAIKTGGFGLTKYRINHAALDYVTLAANARLLKYVIKTVGVDMNIAKMLLTVPEVSVGE